MQKTLYTKDNQEVLIDIGTPADISSFFVFALPKSGSVLQDKIFEDICHELNIPLVSISKSAFKQGVEPNNFKEEVCEIFVRKGYGFYGFRYEDIVFNKSQWIKNILKFLKLDLPEKKYNLSPKNTTFFHQLRIEIRISEK